MELVSRYAVDGCALSARGFSLKAASLGPRWLCKGPVPSGDPARRASPPRRPNLEGIPFRSAPLHSHALQLPWPRIADLPYPSLACDSPLRSALLRLDTIHSAPLDTLGYAGLPLSLRLLLQCLFGALWVGLALVG